MQKNKDPQCREERSLGRPRIARRKVALLSARKRGNVKVKDGWSPDNTEIVDEKK